MQKIVDRPTFCSFETTKGHLDRIMEKKESFGKNMRFANPYDTEGFTKRIPFFTVKSDP